MSWAGLVDLILPWMMIGQRCLELPGWRHTEEAGQAEYYWDRLRVAVAELTHFVWVALPLLFSDRC